MICLVTEIEDWLRKKGINTAQKKSAREASEGLITVSINNSSGVIIEINSETDFVARNENFQKFCLDITNLCLIKKINDVESLLKVDFDDSGNTVENELTNVISKLGENIVIGQFKRLTTAGAFSDYEHTNGKIGVIVEFSGSIDEESGKGIAMQVAAMNPPYISSDQVPQSDLDSEAEIMRNQALSEGKPEQVVDKIVQGRLSKFYKENCLVDQVYVKDQDKQIKDLLSEGTTILSIERFSLAG